jgi:spermidine/putrescine-binding protein
MKINRIIPLIVTTALLVVSPLRAADKELNLFAWSEYIPQSVIDGFEKETGIKVNLETCSSSEEILAKMFAGGTAYDLIQPSDYIAEALIKNKMLVPLDYSKLPNFKNMSPEYLGMPSDPEQKYTIPYMAGTAGIVVNTEKVTEPIKGLNDMFQPKYKNRILVMDDGRELVVAALYTLGLNLNDITEENLEKVRPILAKWLKLVKLFDSDSPKTALLNGDVDIGYVWSGEAAILWNEDKKFQYVLPEEGAHMFVDVLCIPTISKNRDAAHKFLDYIMRPEISAELSNEYPYTNPNSEARKLLSEEQFSNPASYPKLTKKLDTFRHIGESGALIDELVTDLKNSL